MLTPSVAPTTMQEGGTGAMSMKGKGGKGGKASGGGKSRGSSQTVAITKSKARATAAIDGAIVTLRRALFDDDGRDKDVTVGVAAPFLKYDRKGLDVMIGFSAKLRKEEAKWAFDLIKSGMEDLYDASGYGWDDEDKREQLKAPDVRGFDYTQ
jgi:hypothetical protein